jgi:hypothetical protein
MSKTPEERAKAVFDKIIEGDSYDKFGSADVPALIVSAIREAENEALERAAKLCDGITEDLSSGRKQTHSSPYFAGQIRSLQSKG